MPLILFPCQRNVLPHVRKRTQTVEICLLWQTGARLLCGEGNRMKRHILTFSGCGTASRGFSGNSIDGGDGSGGNIYKRNPSVLSPQPTTAYPPACRPGVGFRKRTKELHLSIALTFRDTQQKQQQQQRRPLSSNTHKWAY